MSTWQQLVSEQNSEKIFLAEIELARPDGAGGLETALLRLSSDGLVDLAGCIPCLKAVPDLDRSLPQAMYGRAQASFGTLEIFLDQTTGPETETYLSRAEGWTWYGRPVAIYMGFAELDVEDWREVFTGLCGAVSWTRSTLTVPLRDTAWALDGATVAEQSTTGALPTLVSDLLTAAGVTAIDSVSWTAWAAENAFAAGFKTDGSRTVAEILDELVSQIGCFWFFDRAGLFVIGTFAEPDATDASGCALTIRTPDETFSSKASEEDVRYASVTVEHYTTFPDDTAEVTVSDTDVSDLCALAGDLGPVRTPLTSATDAQTVRDRLFALFSVPRMRLSPETKVQPLLLQLHDQVWVESDRFGWGGAWRVVGLNEHLGKYRTEVELWR